MSSPHWCCGASRGRAVPRSNAVTPSSSAVPSPGTPTCSHAYLIQSGRPRFRSLARTGAIGSCPSGPEDAVTAHRDGPCGAGAALGVDIPAGAPGQLLAPCPRSRAFSPLWGHASQLRRPLHDPGLEGAQVQRGRPHPRLLPGPARGPAPELARGQLLAHQGEDLHGGSFWVSWAGECLPIGRAALPSGTRASGESDDATQTHAWAQESVWPRGRGCRAGPEEPSPSERRGGRGGGDARTWVCRATVPAGSGPGPNPLWPSSP